jgi:prolyl 4-hydroxylase
MSEELEDKLEMRPSSLPTETRCEEMNKDIPMSRLSDWIRVYDDGIPEDLCDRFISKINDDPSFTLNETWRKCTGYSNIDSSSDWDYFKLVIKTLFDRYKSDVNCNGLNHVGFIEAPNVFKYDSSSAEEEHFNYHADTWDMSTASRQLSIIAYLNDVEEGGETDFVDLNISVKPKRGRVLFFPPFYTYQHQGNPPVSNDKYIVVTWLHFRGVGHTYRVHPLT